MVIKKPKNCKFEGCNLKVRSPWSKYCLDHAINKWTENNARQSSKRYTSRKQKLIALMWGTTTKY